MKYVLAIDVAKNKSMVLLANDCGEVLIYPYEINHTLSDFEKLKERIDSFDIYYEDLTIFMESTSTYHYPVRRFFKENMLHEVMVINPLHTAIHKRNLRKTKTDKEDCFNLASLFFSGKVKNYNDHEQYYLNLNALARQYDYLLKINTSFKNRFRNLVNLSFPEYETLFRGSTIFSDTSLSFIEKYPHPEIITNTRVDVLANFMATLNGRHENFYLKKAKKIKETAKSSYSSISTNDDIITNLVTTTRILKYQIKEKKE